MEDSATLLNRSQHLAAMLDKQDADGKLYTPTTGSSEGATYQTATALVFKGLAQPSGYTEPLLHAWRLKVKAAA